MDVFSLH
jgi:hypothetical protein